jgi:ATP-dependent Clp protease ATP-binding subunit ClpC
MNKFEICLSKTSWEAISQAEWTANCMGKSSLLIEYLFFILIEADGNNANEIFESFDLPIAEIKHQVFESERIKWETPHYKNSENKLERVLSTSYFIAKGYKKYMVETEHLVLAILKEQDNYLVDVLSRYQVNYEVVKFILETEH